MADAVNNFGVTDLDAPSDQEATIFDLMRDALSKAVVVDPITLNVPTRPGVQLRFNPVIEFDQYQGWVSRARKAPLPNGKKRDDDTPDYFRLAITVMSHTNTDILFNGKSSGLTVKSESFHTMLKQPAGATGPAIKALFGSDGHVIQAMQKIVEAAGYSMDGDVLNADEDDNPLVS